MPFFRFFLPKDPHQDQPPVGIRISYRDKDCEHYVVHISICNTTSHKPAKREVPKGSQSVHFGAALSVYMKSKCNYHRYSPRHKLCFVSAIPIHVLTNRCTGKNIHRFNGLSWAARSTLRNIFSIPRGACWYFRSTSKRGECGGMRPQVDVSLYR